MTVRVYRSTDASAPVLAGLAGSLISLLDACLVNGYGVSASAGWTKPFSSGATVAVYKQGAGSNGFYLKVNDIGTTYANAWGYETMTDVVTGTNPFPTDSMRATGAANLPYISKSSTGDAQACPWVVIATEKAFHLIVNAQREVSQAPTYPMSVFFGDIVSNKPGDAYGTLIMMLDTTGYTNSSVGSTAGVLNGHFLARAWYQLGNCVPAGKYSDGVRARIGNLPTSTDGLFQCTPYVVFESLTIPRGTLPGMWCPAFSTNPLSVVEGQRFVFTTGDMAGKTLEAHYITSAVLMLFEISNTW